ncbi:MAG: hypothetical protein AAF528_09070 [Cyanobacteria bacterium P01_C01_bin.121]
MNALLGVAAETSGFPVSVSVLFLVGFLAAVGLGSVAWYNSKRPAGWESKERPDIVPKVEK